MSLWQLVATKRPSGSLSLFLAYFHRLVAKGAKSYWSWDGSVWDSRQASAVELLTRDAIVEKIAYVLANPVAAGAVLDPEDWPGAKMRVADIGQTVMRAKRPKVSFDPAQWREHSELLIKLPPMIAEEDAEAFRNEVAKELALQVAIARQTIAPENVLGAKRATTISPETRSTTPEPIRKLNPTFAVGRGPADIAIVAARAVKTFRAAYRAAIDARWAINGASSNVVYGDIQMDWGGQSQRYRDTEMLSALRFVRHEHAVFSTQRA